MFSITAVLTLALAGSAAAVPLNSKNALQKRDYTGTMTYTGPGTGACGDGYTQGTTGVAISYTLWTAANPNSDPLCGQWIWISYGGKQARAQVWDKCPSCDTGHIDVAEGVFTQLSPLDPGHVEVTWGFESGGSPGTGTTPSAPVNTPIATAVPTANPVATSPAVEPISSSPGDDWFATSDPVDNATPLVNPIVTPVPAPASTQTYNDGFYTPGVY